MMVWQCDGVTLLYDVEMLRHSDGMSWRDERGERLFSSLTTKSIDRSSLARIS